MKELVLVLDFGGQYKELIAGATRQLSVYSEIKKGGLSAEEIKRLNPIGIILTGGPNSVYAQNAPVCENEIFNLGIPVLGICYGMHLICHTLGGKVEPSAVGEYGRVAVEPTKTSALAKEPFTALMSHRDCVAALPKGFDVTMRTETCVAAFENPQLKIYGVQFHPETKHTENGGNILKRFLYDICGARGDYKIDDYIQGKIGEIRERVREGEKVLLGLSGGVDSSVCAALIAKAIPSQLTCVFVDHGFMRLNEGDEIEELFGGNSQLNFIRVDAKERFLSKLKGVREPELKRKLIGEEFVRVFEEQALKLKAHQFLAQGTIYPDIVESGDENGAVIKSHHNVGGLPTDLNFTGLIEPLSGLFKDEVRELGKRLGLPDKIVNRQPFPGPGLAVRIVGEITQEKLDVLRSVDAIFREEVDRANLETKPDQYFAVMTDTYSVGVKGDGRTYSPVIALRAVNTDDFMTCEYTQLPHEVLGRASSRITNEIPSVSRVVYDISSKPPSTIEWE